MGFVNRAVQELLRIDPNLAEGNRSGAQMRLGAELKIGQSTLSRILRCERTPGTTVRRRFWELRKIPMHWWDEPALDAEQLAHRSDPTGTDD